jgi:hypothetical protein
VTKRWDPRSIWLDLLLRPWALAAMVGCVGASLAKLLALLAVEAPVFLPIAGVLGTLAGYYIYHLTRTFIPSGQDRQNFRALTLVVAFLALKVISYVGRPLAIARADVRSWLVKPYLFFDSRTLTGFVFFFLGWVIALRTAADFDRIGLPSKNDDEVPPWQTLQGRFFVGGVLLMIFSGIARLGIADLLNMERPPVPGLLLNVLLYFGLGLIFMGQTHFVVLMTRWRKQRVRIARGLEGRWVWYTLIFLSLAALIAFILPTGYTVPLLDILAWIFYFIGLFVWFIIYLVQLLLLPIAWLMEQLTGRQAQQPDFSPMPTPQALPDVAPQEGGPSWFVILRSLLFWGVVVGILVTLIRNYVQDNPAFVAALLRLRIVKTLRAWGRGFWRWLRGATTALVERLPEGLRPDRRHATVGKDSDAQEQQRADTARAKVLATYLATLEEAREEGVPRRDSQTPNEYRGTLSPVIPDAVPQVDELTAVFVEARYSRHPLTQADVERARADAQRVRQALLARRRQRQEGSVSPAEDDV